SAPHVVLMPFVANRSFAPHGIPCSGPRYLPALISLSACSACFIASSSVSVTTHRSFGPYRLSRDRYILVNSTGDTLRVRTSSDSSATVKNASSSTDLKDGAVRRRVCRAATLEVRAPIEALRAESPA